jgi:hypothetical protein
MLVLATSPEKIGSCLRGSANEAFALVQQHPPEKVQNAQERFKRIS